VPVATALKSLTIWPAWQHFEENSKGSIEIGTLADFVILSDDPLKVPSQQLADLKVLETIKGGVSIYKRPEGSAAISSPALFGLSPLVSHDAQDNIGEIEHVHGDGCFNYGLNVLVQALSRRDSMAGPALVAGSPE
jgi:hypothetical protein